MERSDEPTEMDLGHDELNALKGGFRRGAVIEKKEDAGDDLNRKQEQRHAAEVIPNGVPVNGNRLFANQFLQRCATDSLIQPGLAWIVRPDRAYIRSVHAQPPNEPSQTLETTISSPRTFTE